MSAIQRLRDFCSEYEALGSAISLMNWDRQVLMPPGGAEARTAQVGRLVRLQYELLASEKTLRTVEDARKETEERTPERRLVEVLQRTIDTHAKLPLSLVERKTQVSSDAYEAWKKAKATSDFETLRPYLEQLFEIAGETAAKLGYQDHIYDPLIDLFEEGATYGQAKTLFEGLKQPLIDLVAEVKARGREVDDSYLKRDWDQEALRAFAQRTASQIGFDFTRGRLDIGPSAFCTGLGFGDTRMTTRASDHIKGILSSTLHEMGHALYDQNAPEEWKGTPLADGVSLGVHESQSRLWENIIGRSNGFWKFFFPHLVEAFPFLAGRSPEEFYRSYNKVEPTYIRVGADELTYNLHILVRFELEVEILTSQLAVRDLPDAWNTKYRDYLGITPPNDSLGCLQDVHWSRGTVGYFPTYMMGNLIGGQVWKCLNQDLGDVDALLAEGQIRPVLGWLTDKIYSKGSLFKPSILVEQVTGKPMAPHDWLEYATVKFRQIYEL